MNGGRKISQGLFVVAACGSFPKPALIRLLNLDLFPETLDLPVPVNVELSHVNGAASLPDLLHAVQAFSHESKVAFVFFAVLFVPGAG